VAADDPRSANFTSASAFNGDRSKIVRMSLAAVFDKHRLFGANEAIEPSGATLDGRFAQARRTRLHDFARQLRHA
jgi:hypothetical protein